MIFEYVLSVILVAIYLSLIAPHLERRIEVELFPFFFVGISSLSKFFNQFSNMILCTDQNFYIMPSVCRNIGTTLVIYFVILVFQNIICGKVSTFYLFKTLNLKKN